MPTAPTPITPYSTPPSSTDSANFDTRADAKVAQDAVFVVEANALAENAYDNAVEAAASAGQADASADDAIAAAAAAVANASAAASSAGAPPWVSGTLYAPGDKRESPVTGLIYRRRTNGAGAIDPSLDTTNWSLVGSGGLQQVIETGGTATLAANTHTLMKSASAWAATAPTSPGLNEALILQWDNARRDNTLDLGTNGMKGLNGATRSGVITLNVLGPLRIRWWGDFWRYF